MMARERQRGAQQRSTGRVRPRFGESGGQLDRRRARGVLNPCARESNARTGMILREKLISDHDLFSSFEGQQGAANGQESGDIFQVCTGLWTAGCWLPCVVYVCCHLIDSGRQGCGTQVPTSERFEVTN